MNSDPALIAKRRASIIATYADPAFKARNRLQRIAIRRAYLATEEGQAEAKATGARLGKMKCGMSKYPAGHPLRLVAGAKKTATHLAWCPIEYRGEYKRLRGYRGAAKAKEIILDQIKAARAAMSPFERQQAALEAKMQRGETQLLSSNEPFRRRAA